MKKIICLLLVVLLGLAVVACSSNENDQDTEALENNGYEDNGETERDYEAAAGSEEIYNAVRENSEGILRNINFMFQTFGEDAVEVRVAEGGNLFMIPRSPMLIGFMNEAHDNSEIADTLIDTMVTLSDSIATVYNIEGINITLTSTVSESLPALTVRDGEVTIDMLSSRD